jgi:cytoskeletal protein RodZ
VAVDGAATTVFFGTKHLSLRRGQVRLTVPARDVYRRSVEHLPRPAFRDVGTTLREARKRRGCTLQDISSATNISIRLLDGIERGDLARVPGGIFMRAHLRAYATQVGLNPEHIVTEYLAQHEIAREREDDALRELRIRCANRGGRRDASWIRPAFLATLVALIIYSMFFSGSAQSPLADPTIKSVPAADEPRPRRDVPVAQLKKVPWLGSALT